MLKRGKAEAPHRVGPVRELAREELAHLALPRIDGPSVARFRDSHHMLARLFASGLRLKEISTRSGYSYNRVMQFDRDPAFQDLVAHYRAKVDEAFVKNTDEYLSLATSNMLKAERQIADQLDEADEDGADPISLPKLISISRDAADRFGYGKRQTQVNLNVDFAAQLERAIKRSASAPSLAPTTTADAQASDAAGGSLLEASEDPSPRSPPQGPQPHTASHLVGSLPSGESGLTTGWRDTAPSLMQAADAPSKPAEDVDPTSQATSTSSPFRRRLRSVA